jgi:hypothetical protein
MHRMLLLLWLSKWSLEKNMEALSNGYIQER